MAAKSEPVTSRPIAAFANGSQRFVLKAIPRRTQGETGMNAGRKAIAALVVALAAILAAVAPPVAAADLSPAQEARLAAETSLRSSRLQTELPADAGKEKYEPEKSVSLNLSPETARVILWAALACIALIILKTFRDNVWSASRSRRLAHAEEEKRAPAGVAARLDKAQGEADDLARHGSFAEAMHVLLLRSVSELRLRLGVSIAVSLTSREILQRLALAPAERSHFADIIASVEISYFGAHQPDETDYLRCRHSFEALSAALRREGGR